MFYAALAKCGSPYCEQTEELQALPFAAISYPEKTPYSLATHYAGMQKYGIILARQCALTDSCLLVLGIKKSWSISLI